MGDEMMSKGYESEFDQISKDEEKYGKIPTHEEFDGLLLSGELSPSRALEILDAIEALDYVRENFEEWRTSTILGNESILSDPQLLPQLKAFWKLMNDADAQALKAHSENSSTPLWVKEMAGARASDLLKNSSHYVHVNLNKESL